MRQIFNSISGGFNHWCTRFDQWFMKLQYWQKGAIIGGGGHLVAVLVLIVLFIIFVPVSPPPLGSLDIGPAIGWILLFFYTLLEIIPDWILYLFTGLHFRGPEVVIWIWVLYLIYSTLFYALIGIAVAKAITLVKKSESGTRDDKQEN